MGLTLANNLKIKRRQLGLTQQLISNLLNLERSTYAYYETGKTTPSVETLAKLSELFDCSIEELLTVPAPVLREEPGFSLKEDTLAPVKVAKRLIFKISSLNLDDRLIVEDLVDKLLEEKSNGAAK